MATDDMRDPKDRNTLIERSRPALVKALERLRGMTPTPVGGSPIAVLLGERAEEIREAMSRGWSAHAIARAIADEHAAFTADAIRVHLRRMFGAPGVSPSRKASSRKRSASVSTAVNAPVSTPVSSSVSMPVARPTATEAPVVTSRVRSSETMPTHQGSRRHVI